MYTQNGGLTWAHHQVSRDVLRNRVTSLAHEKLFSQPAFNILFSNLLFSIHRRVNNKQLPQNNFAVCNFLKLAEHCSGMNIFTKLSQKTGQQNFPEI